MREVSITTGSRGSVAVAAVAGDIDLVNHDEVLQRLLGIALDSGPRLVVDVTAVRYVDSNGVRMLFELANELHQARVEWAVALNDESPLMRLLKVTAFDEVAEIFATATEAAASLGV
jgi:anti-sigma B factor antagonist